MAHIVVLGAGIGGIPMAYEMKDLTRPEDRITVVSNTDHFQFVPSNPWVAVGWRRREDITVPLAEPFARKGIAFRPVGCRRVLPEENALELNDGSRLGYDQLVIATGPELAFDEIEGFGPQANTISICHVDHAVEAAKRWEEFCRNPGPLVIGAVQGASCFGPAYEFAMIADADLRRRKIRHKVPITFVTSEPYIGHLGLGGVGDTKGLLESALRERHIRWIVNARTDRFEPEAVHVTEFGEDGQEKAKHVIESRLTMMLPAFRGIGALRGVEGLVNPRGFVLTDKHQRNPTHRNVFGVGVCIAIPPVEKTPVPVGVPKTGYMIETMVTATARNIRALLDGTEPTEEPTWNALCLADFGDSGVAFVAMPQIPPRNVNWAAHGRWVHLAKVGFERYFLRKVRKGISEPVYERYVLKLLGLKRVQEPSPETTDV
ncbi:NAD(P)/FAD-dependent oxidoreductase [Azospirillum rugosum]|uniref:Sulfide:quinone oxidoreductase n=1 Tax=Azospirillum rugosum TaxID=416170 RepID=A0ABS4SUK9_9PROT|nr:FAD-dependent oxidoreductase [Azospirillum rugosum]MBP2296252.1 sulfide:quinone oxidoreductase [Azospirillum rugosum]MDQ0529773.1 sulfide:quinone oxidoreductase [Azospirillum rugosum]